MPKRVREFLARTKQSARNKAARWLKKNPAYGDKIVSVKLLKVGDWRKPRQGLNRFTVRFSGKSTVPKIITVAGKSYITNYFVFNTRKQAMASAKSMRGYARRYRTYRLRTKVKEVNGKFYIYTNTEW